MPPPSSCSLPAGHPTPAPVPLLTTPRPPARAGAFACAAHTDTSEGERPSEVSVPSATHYALRAASRAALRGACAAFVTAAAPPVGYPWPMQHGTNGTVAGTGGTLSRKSRNCWGSPHARSVSASTRAAYRPRTPHGWAVQLDAELAAPTTAPPAPAELEELQELPALTEPVAARAEPGGPAAPSAELTALREQVAWFQAGIERRDTAKAEQGGLLAVALQRPALPAQSRIRGTTEPDRHPP